MQRKLIRLVTLRKELALGDKGGKKDKEKNKQQQVNKRKEEDQKRQDKNRPQAGKTP